MIKRELPIFLVVGCLTVLVDFCAYHALIWLDALPISAAKGIGFVAGAIFAYLANRSWTFSATPPSDGSIWRFSLLYAATLGTNVLVNATALHVFGERQGALLAAFLVATGCSAALNFIGMKFFVFATKAEFEIP